MGHIIVTTEGGKIVKWEWKDGPDARISSDLLHDAEDGVFSTRTPQPGDTLTVGPFTVRAVGYDEHGTLTVQRIDT